MTCSLYRVLANIMTNWANKFIWDAAEMNSKSPWIASRFFFSHNGYYEDSIIYARNSERVVQLDRAIHNKIEPNSQKCDE